MVYIIIGKVNGISHSQHQINPAECLLGDDRVPCCLGYPFLCLSSQLQPRCQMIMCNLSRLLQESGKEGGSPGGESWPFCAELRSKLTIFFALHIREQIDLLPHCIMTQKQLSWRDVWMQFPRQSMKHGISSLGSHDFPQTLWNSRQAPQGPKRG